MFNTLRVFCLLSSGLLLFSCGSPPHDQSEAPPGDPGAETPGYEVVFVIHGDGDYLFHDPEGNRHRADEEALAGAERAAMHNSQAEVFIFHEIHRRHRFFLFPRHDGEFYYYRYGKLLAQASYWRDRGKSRFDPEVDLYYRYHIAGQPQSKKLFLYFGHEIPEFDGANYDASYRKRSFTVEDLADGLRRLTRDSTKFDLVVLSTCFNGTPHTVSALTPYARYIMASPGNLHLSYFDLRPFQALDSGLSDGNVSAFAKECARQSFNRLTTDIQTEITVAVYDVDQVQGYLSSVDSVYNQSLTGLKKDTRASKAHCDCAEDTAFVRPSMSEGVDMFFRSANFGRSAHKRTHSGWECWRELE